MSTNNFKAFATGAGANVLSQADYEALAALLTGFQSGKASSAQINKALRQSTTMGAALAQFIVSNGGVDVLDNGDVQGIATKLLSALQVLTLQRQNPFSDIKADGNVAAALANIGLQAASDNMIINGSFIINQRGYSSGNALTAGSYAHDRWKAGSGGAAYSFGTTAETITITSGTLIQVIEGLNNYGDPLTLVWDGTAQCRVNGGAYSASPLTVNNLAAGSNITIEFGTGSVARVQCSPGVVPFRYRRRQYGDELRLCQRYYQMSTSGTTGTFAPNGSDSHVPWFMKVTMRAAPTVLLSGGNGTVYQSSPDYVDVKLTAGSQSYAVIVNISCAAEL